MNLLSPRVEATLGFGTKPLRGTKCLSILLSERWPRYLPLHLSGEGICFQNEASCGVAQFNLHQIIAR
jgi:hypothetical protein